MAKELSENKQFMIISHKKSIGILGGSFDPPHKGHLKISLTALKDLKLDKLFWIVTKKNPFKKKPLFSLEQRLYLCKKIVKKNKKIKIQFLEKYTKSPRSINVIKYLKKKYGNADIFLLIGSDNLIKLHKWKDWEKIIEICKLVVFSRKGFDKKAQKSPIIKHVPSKKIIYIKNSKIDISSSKLREIYLR